MFLILFRPHIVNKIIYNMKNIKLTYVDLFRTTILGVLIVLITINVSAQTVKTPNGTSVGVSSLSELTTSEIAFYNSQATSQFPNAVLLGNSSGKYNCHAFAWYMTPCPSCPPYWMNTPGDDVYWNDCSYLETTASAGRKISYVGTDHSAIKSSVSGKFESKWGMGPKMRHDPYDTPYDDVTSLKYYVRPVVSGPSLVCSSGSFALNDLPSGYTATWSVSPTYLFTGTTSGTGIYAAINANVSSAAGKAVISYSVNTSCGIVNYSKDIWVGKPLPIIAGPSDFPFNTSQNFYADGLDNANPSNFNWSVFPSGFEWIGGQGSSGVSISIGSTGSHSIQVSVTNPCGTIGTELAVYVGDGASMLVIYPNPVSDVLTISEKSSLFAFAPDSREYDADLFNSAGEKLLSTKSSGGKVQMDVSKLENGFYYVHIRYGDKVIKKQVRINR